MLFIGYCIIYFYDNCNPTAAHSCVQCDGHTTMNKLKSSGLYTFQMENFMMCELYHTKTVKNKNVSEVLFLNAEVLRTPVGIC